MGSERRLAPVLDHLAFFLGSLGVVLRLAVHAATAGSGMNLFIHLLFWIALGAWFGARAAEGGVTYRFTGFEFAFLAWTIVSLVSVERASYRLPALEHALRDLSFALLFVLAIQAMGARTLLGLLLPALVALSVYAILQFTVLFPQLDVSGLSVELVRRAGSRRPWATFRGPNQLAGFLALLLPVLLGYTRDSRVRWPGRAALAVGLVALALTGSLGAWISLGAGGAAFLALALTRSRGRGRILGAGGAVLGGVLLIAVSTPLLEGLGRKSFSLHVRRVYWQAAWKIFAQHPIGGVGLDNFREHYYAAKPETPEETTHAHNDYLQVLAETGVFGFLAFGALAALGMRRALGPAAGPGGAMPERSWALLGAAAGGIVSGMLTSELVLGPYLFVWIVTGAAWLGSHVLFRLAAPDPELPWTRIGVASGLTALGVHMTVDFDFYEPALAMTLMLALALAACLGRDPAPVRMPAWACGAAAGILALLSIPLLGWMVPRLMAADSEIETARKPGPEDLRRAAASAAARHNPFSAEAHEIAARWTFVEWTRLRARALQDDSGRLECLQTQELVLHSLGNAIALRPLSSPLHDRMASYHRAFRGLSLDLFRASRGRDSIAEGQAKDHLRLALLGEGRAVELYPSYPPIRYSLARLWDEDGRPSEAEREYREALRLNEGVAAEPFSTDRMRLSLLARARCYVRLGDRARAISLFASAPRLPADELSEEWDDLMGAVIQEARKSTMGPVKPRGNP